MIFIASFIRHFKERFETMTNAVLATVPCEAAFARGQQQEQQQEQEYHQFVGTAATCLASLALAVGKDVLWKPGNHKLLLMTRSNRKSVRLAAVKVLLTMFQEVSFRFSGNCCCCGGGGTLIIASAISLHLASCHFTLLYFTFA